MTTIEPVGSTEHLILLYDVGEVEMRKAHRGAKAKHLIASCPVAQRDRHSVRVILVEVRNVFGIFSHVGAQFLTVCLIHVGNSIKGSLYVPFHVLFQVVENLFHETVEIFLFARCNI